MGTIMDALKKRYSGITNIDEAENIAEILSGVKGAGEPIEVYIDGFNIFTVLYTDGTLIINELIKDREANIAEHGEVVKEYDPWCTRQPYVFKIPADRPWHKEQKSVLSVKFGSEVKPVRMAGWFSGFQNCTSFDFSGLDTSKVTNFNSTFFNCSGLISLDLSSFDTSSATIMAGMFYGCSGLTSLDLSSFDTSKVGSFNSMFYGCSGLTSLDVSGLDTSSATSMAKMFYGCSGLTALDVSGFDTSKVQNFEEMFRGCKALTSLDLSNFDTCNVTAMKEMFYDLDEVTELDLSSFDTSKVTNMASMFRTCAKLATIIVSDKFVTTAVTSSGSMFSSSTNLVGGNGTTYDTNHVDAEYARIDTEETPGYFTAASVVETS